MCTIIWRIGHRVVLVWISVSSRLNLRSMVSMLLRILLLMAPLRFRRSLTVGEAMYLDSTNGLSAGTSLGSE